SGWTECVALVAREQTLVVEALEALQPQLPIPLLGIDTDNDGAFINESLIKYCESHDVEFTRSRAYLKNDQAWIEQKNGAVVRRFVGHQRLKGILAAQVLGRLHRLTRLYVNFFQPSFKLRHKTREGAKVRKSYFPPATPCDRLLKNEKVSEEAKERLREQKASLDPVQLLHTIRELQATLAALASSNGYENGATPESKSLAEFLKQLPRLWKDGEVRPTHRKAPSSPRNWRTRVDPFESVWPELLDWLQRDPDTTAKDLFQRLRTKYPGTYKDGQLRTLQRRVRGWRRAMARELIGISQAS
ncbi:MAG: transposase, partial [Desulfobacteria bacterium]